MIVLDTNIIIYFPEGRLDGPLEPTPVFASVISEIEMLSHDRLDDQAIAVIQGFLASVQIVGLDREVRDETISLRRQHHLKVPDAIVGEKGTFQNAIKLSRISSFFQAFT